MEMIYQLPRATPVMRGGRRTSRARSERRRGLGQSEFTGGGLYSYISSPPPGTDVWDVIENALGVPLTANQTAAINAQTAQAVTQACGQYTGTQYCNQQLQTAQQDVTAAADQSNEELQGFPYTTYNAAANLWPSISNLGTSIPTWLWIALGGLGFILIFDLVR
jgi:hypothetical protein